MRLSEPFENELVPDAFGVQLLSRGHQLEFSERRDWQVAPLPSNRLLVWHVNPAAWFDGSLVRFGDHETPPFVLGAREDFAPILFRDEIALRWKDERGQSSRRRLRECP
jgi:hypothetical protein